MQSKQRCKEEKPLRPGGLALNLLQQKQEVHEEWLNIMAANKILSFPKKTGPSKKQKSDPEKLSRALVQELTKDEAYRKFANAAEVQKRLGEAISRTRKRKKLSAAELAKRIQKPERVITRMEKGEYKQYTMKLLLDIAHALNARLRIDLED